MKTGLLLIFDTSALNAITDAPDKNWLVSAILQRYRVLITALSLYEVIATTTTDRRRDLSGTARLLADGTRPIPAPNTLLKIATKAHLRAQDSITVTIATGGRDEPLWWMLDRPTIAGDEERSAAAAYLNDLEAGFVSAHNAARPEFQQIFDDDEPSRPKTISALFRHFRTHDDAIFTVCRKAYPCPPLLANAKLDSNSTKTAV